MAQFDAKRLTPFDWGVIGGGAVMFIASFLAWRSASVSGGGSILNGSAGSESGWSAGGLAILAILLSIAAAAWWFAYRGMGVAVNGLPTGPAVLALGLAALSLLFVLIRFLTAFDSRGTLGIKVSISPGFGLYLGLLAVIVQTVCAYLLVKAAGESLPWQSRRAGPASPEPPPAV